MSLVAKEKRSFEQLIVAKETLVISLPDNAVDLEKERLLSLDSGAVHSSDTRINSSKYGSGGDKKNMKIVVDVRDFRSILPSLLYGGGLAVVPRTLLVGDYVLSSEVCVERKGISDLFQSLASGRLYNQVQQLFALFIIF
jgi:DNA excision repair protein ERCC-4